MIKMPANRSAGDLLSVVAAVFAPRQISSLASGSTDVVRRLVQNYRANLHCALCRKQFQWLSDSDETGL